MTEPLFDYLRRRREERRAKRPSMQCPDDPVGCPPNAAIDRLEEACRVAGRIVRLDRCKPRESEHSDGDTDESR